MTTAIATHRRLVTLKYVNANPYQTRLGDDPAHVAALAEDILANGLLQVPLARPHPTLSGVVELAFGHSRRDAYQLLAEQGRSEYAEFPVEIRDLSDRQMSDFAAAENARRKNLTAIETATALQRRIADFKLTQAEAGAPFGLSQSGVANLLRLLKLPAEIQDDVQKGALPERVARQLATVAGLAPKETAKLAKELAAAKPADRDQELAEGLSEILEEHGRELRDAAFDVDFAPAAVASDGEPVRECRGCPFAYEARWNTYCLRPPCFDAKQPLGVQAAVDAAQIKTGLAVANGEKTHALPNDWQYSRHLPALIKAGRTDAALGLRLAAAADGKRRYAGGDDNLTGSRYVCVVTTAPAAVKAWLAAQQKGNGTGKAVKVETKAPPAKNETPAQKAKREAAEAKAREAERAAAEERRRERGRVLRVEADVVWLVKHFTEIVAAQLTISGPVLAYVNDRLVRSNRQLASGFYGLNDWHDEIKTQAEGAKGKDADVLRRQWFVAAQVFERALPWGGANRDDCWGHVVDHLVDLASDHSDEGETGLGAKLPVGWNKPPIHKTPTNCWKCGRFGSARGRLTKGELEAGWVRAEQGGAVTDVRCPECQTKTPAKGKGKK